MKTQLENYRLQIATREFSDPAGLRESIHQLHGVDDIARRQELSEDLLSSVRLNDGSQLIDTVYSAIDADGKGQKTEAVAAIDEQLTAAEARAERVIRELTRVTIAGRPGEFPRFGSKGVGDLIQLDVSPEGDLKDITYVERMPEDKRATRQGQRISKHAPSGPVTNTVRLLGAIPGTKYGR